MEHERQGISRSIACLQEEGEAPEHRENSDQFTLEYYSVVVNRKVGWPA